MLRRLSRLIPIFFSVIFCTILMSSGTSTFAAEQWWVYSAQNHQCYPAANYNGVNVTPERVVRIYGCGLNNELLNKHGWLIVDCTKTSLKNQMFYGSSMSACMKLSSSMRLLAGNR